MLNRFFSAVVIFFQSIFGISPAILSSTGVATIVPPLVDYSASDFVTNEISPIFPLRRWDIPDIETDTTAAIAFDIDANKILFQKNIFKAQPIASLTKLMTAVVFLENGDLNQEIEVSRNAINTYGTMGNLAVGEKITARGLFYALLMQSSNDAAVALTEGLKEGRGSDMIELMNKKAIELGMDKTSFKDSSGLSEENISTAWDLTILTKYL